MRAIDYGSASADDPRGEAAQKAGLRAMQMDDIEALCSRVMVIAEGKILSDGPLSALRRAVAPERWLTIDLAEGIDQQTASHA